MSKHLVIKQTATQENVSSAVIDKLYNLTYEDSTLGIDPEVDSQRGDIVGNIRPTAAYEDAVEFLKNKFGPDVENNIDGLTIDISTNDCYIRFKDSNVLSVLLNNGIGDGIGITKTVAAQQTSLPTFADNTDITSFDELKYFTTFTVIPRASFMGCSNLKSINLENIRILNSQAFLNCDLTDFDVNCPVLSNIGFGSFSDTNIKTVSNLGTVPQLPEYTFGNCTKLEKVILPITLTTIDMEVFNNNNLLSEINVENISSIGANNFSYCTSLPELMNFSSLTTLSLRVSNNIFDNRNSGFLNLQSVYYLYLPKLTQLYHGCDKGGNNVVGTFTRPGFGNTCSSFKMIYFKDLQSLYTGCFGGSNILKLVINNVTPPSVIKSTNANADVDSIIGSNQSRTNIGAIYVPDSAVNTYKDTTNYPYWAALSSIIHPISELDTVADEETFNALSDTDKANTLIAAYM